MKNSFAKANLVLSLAASLLVAESAIGHIEMGRWVGTSSSGQECEMLVGKQSFENSMPHPLNERIEITINGLQFRVYHPPMIDINSMSAGFDHDHFHGVQPNKSGAQAIVIDMVHSSTFEGPSAYHWIDHNYKSGKKESVTCTGLVLKHSPL